MYLFFFFYIGKHVTASFESIYLCFGDDALSYFVTFEWFKRVKGTRTFIEKVTEK